MQRTDGCTTFFSPEHFPAGRSPPVSSTPEHTPPFIATLNVDQMLLHGCYAGSVLVFEQSILHLPHDTESSRWIV